MKRRQNNFIKRDSAEERSILKMLCPSILGIMVCVICLAGMSWAWFTAGVQSQSTITAASYTLGETVRVKQEDSSPASPALKKSADGTYTLAANTQYEVKLKPTATPKNGGYCIVKITYSDGSSGTMEVSYCTAALTKDTEFSFTISNGGKDAKCQFMAAWGTPDASEFTGGKAVQSGDVITLNGGAPAQNTSDENAGSTDAAEPSSSDNAGNSGTDSSDKGAQSNADGKNSQQPTDKNSDSTGKNTDNAGSSQTGTE